MYFLRIYSFAHACASRLFQKGINRGAPTSGAHSSPRARAVNMSPGPLLKKAAAPKRRDSPTPPQVAPVSMRLNQAHTYGSSPSRVLPAHSSPLGYGDSVGIRGTETPSPSPLSPIGHELGANPRTFEAEIPPLMSLNVNLSPRTTVKFNKHSSSAIVGGKPRNFSYRPVNNFVGGPSRFHLPVPNGDNRNISNMYSDNHQRQNVIKSFRHIHTCTNYEKS